MHEGSPHIPVLLDEVVSALEIEPGDVMVDATLGAGGYTRRLLDAGAAHGRTEADRARNACLCQVLYATGMRVTWSPDRAPRQIRYRSRSAASVAS